MSFFSNEKLKEAKNFIDNATIKGYCGEAYDQHDIIIFAIIAKIYYQNGISTIISIGVGCGYIEKIISILVPEIRILAFDVKGHSDNERFSSERYFTPITIMKNNETPELFDSYKYQLDTTFANCDYSKTGIMMLYPKNWGNVYIAHYMQNGGNHVILGARYGYTLNNIGIYGIFDTCYLGIPYEMVPITNIQIKIPDGREYHFNEIYIMTTKEIICEIEKNILDKKIIIKKFCKQSLHEFYLSCPEIINNIKESFEECDFF